MSLGPLAAASAVSGPVVDVYGAAFDSLAGLHAGGFASAQGDPISFS